MTRRWRQHADLDVYNRAAGIALDRGDWWLQPWHFLLALLDPPAPTIAATVLVELGVERGDVESLIWRERGPRPHEGVGSTPIVTQLQGMARGIAVASGKEEVDDDDVLVALLYEDLAALPHWTIRLGIDADDVIAALRARNAVVPDALPPARRPAGPYGPTVYFPTEERARVHRALLAAFPPPRGAWGTGFESAWKPGMDYVDSAEGLGVADVVRATVADPLRVEEVAAAEAHAMEERHGRP